MREPLTIAVAQPRCVPYDVAANAAAHARAIRAADAPPVTVDDPRLEAIVAACQETRTLALVGAPVPGEHVAILAVDARGTTLAYHKMWLGYRDTAGRSAIWTPDGEVRVRAGAEVGAVVRATLS
jgi:predicted amidohydrolase